MTWLALVKRVFEIDGLVCAQCQGGMTRVSLMTQVLVIRKILEHVGLSRSFCGSLVLLIEALGCDFVGTAFVLWVIFGS